MEGKTNQNHLKPFLIEFLRSFVSIQCGFIWSYVILRTWTLRPSIAAAHHSSGTIFYHSSMR